MTDKTYTVFIRETGNPADGTMFVTSVTASGPGAAMTKGMDECATSWGMTTASLEAVGCAAGDVEILNWCDAGYTYDELPSQGDPE
jgi:hypothetical protein